MKAAVYIFVFLSGLLSFAQSNVAFDQGNTLYNEGKYQEAISIYESILNNGQHSAEMYYNLGNAYYKLNSIAPSIYYFEKALKLKPKDKDIQNNLAFARNMTVDAIEAVPEVGFNRIMKSIIYMFNFDDWAKLSVGFSLAFVLLFLMYYFSYSTARKRLLFLSSFISLGLMVIVLFFAFQNYSLEKNDNPAIIFSQESQIKTEPNLRSETAFLLHEGSKVQILEMYDNNWAKIKIADGKTGWIAFDDIKPLNDI